MFSLALALVASTSIGSPTSPPAITRFKDDPPIHVSVSSNSFIRGQRARVYIQAAEDGYVVVLRADAQGRVRVLYPLDPSADAVTPGGRKFEVRAGGDREAFTVDDAEGTGVVLAAWSESPFNFDEFVNGDHWDVDALGARHGDADVEQNDDGDREAQPDAEQIAPDAALVAVVQRMAGDNHFDYDVASYVVNSATAYNDDRDRRPDDTESQDSELQDRGSNDGPYYGAPYYGPWYGPGYSGVSLSLGFGSHWRYGRAGFGTFCDGYYWSTWGCGPFWDPFYYPVVYSSWYRPHGYRSYGFGYSRSYRQPFRGYRSGTSWGFAQPRVRVPLGGGFSSGSSRGYVGSRTGTRVSGGYSRSSGGYSRSSGGYSRPSGGYSRPSGGYSRPSGGYSRPSGGYSRPSGGYSRPSGGYSRPSGGYSRPSGGYSRPSGGSARSSGGYSRSGGGSSRSSGGYSRSSGGGGGGGGGRQGGGGGGGRRH